jgi:hypothetical protein
MAMISRYAICLGLVLLFVGHDSWGKDIDPRTQCDTIMKGETESDRSYQPIYRPCCNDPAAMKSKEAMYKCIGQRGVEELQKLGVKITPPSAEMQAPPLEVLSWSCSKEYSYIFVKGEVKNVSSNAIENVMAIGTFRTNDGTFVKSRDALIDYNPLLPGQVSPFKAGDTNNPAIKKCEVSFKTLWGKAINFVDKSKRK